MIVQFIKSNFEFVINEQIRLGYKHDYEMIQAIKSKVLTKDMVIRWMIGYGLFQGIVTGYRTKIAKEFIDFANQIKNFENINIEQNFKDLHSIFCRVKMRTWLSATSKLLWCAYPDQIVIYDAFVGRSMSVLQCLDKDLAKLPRIDYPTRVKSEKDIELLANYYMNYQNMVKLLVIKYQDTINALKNEYKSKYKYNLRIMDKILWLMGDMNSEFILGDIECKN